MVFPPADERNEFLAHFAVDGAPGEQMFRPIDLRRLGQNRGAAVTDKFIGSHTQGGIGGDAAVAIGTAAVFGQD